MRSLRYMLLLLLLAGFVACGTQPAPDEEVGISRLWDYDNVFRGRWWSYYERGTGLMESADYAAAADDFQEALALHDSDSWRARTYGLHFVEYFPSRELGIAYFQLGELQQAEEYLRKSLEQIDTERAHHFLDEVQRAKIAQGLISDIDAPELDATAQGMLLNDRDLELQIAARDDVGVAEVSVNGERLYQRGSAETVVFQKMMLLEEGPQELAVQARDLAEKEQAQTVQVTVDLTGPTLGFNSPTAELLTTEDAVRLDGIALDQHGVVEVALDGAPVAQAAVGAASLPFSSMLTLQDGENIFVVTARDAAGNETRSALRVYRGDPASRHARLWRLQQRQPEALLTASATHMLLDALLAQAEEETAEIRLKSPDPERPYRHNRTLRVSGEVVAPSPIAELAINGEPLGEIPHTPTVSFNKRLPIDEEMLTEEGIEVPLSITARTEAGEEIARDVSVRVQPVLLDDPEFMMPIAVTDFTAEDAEPARASLVRLTTEEQLHDLDRFRLVDRTQLEALLAEQQLASLADPKDAIQIGKLVNAHVILYGALFAQENAGLEVKATAVNTESGEIIEHLDVFIPNSADAEAVRQGCANLAEQFAALFPRLSGEVLRQRGDEIMVNWTEEDGVRPGTYLVLIYKEEDEVDPDTGEVLWPGDAYEVARAQVEKVLSMGTRAAIRERKDEEGTAVEEGMPALSM